MTKGLMVGLSVCEKKISILISFFEITLGMLKLLTLISFVFVF